MIRLGAGLEHGVLDLDEIADLGAGADLAAWAEPGKRADLRAFMDRNPPEVAKRQDSCPPGHPYPWAEDHVGTNLDVLVELGVAGEKHGFRADQRRAP